jgi:prophage regulatory protein
MDKDVEIAFSELRKIDLMKKLERKKRIRAKEASSFLTIHQVLELVPFCKGTLYNMMKRGEFPKSKSISDNMVAWSKNDVNAWISEKLGA